ncbi:GntR family transcriptional regulator [Alsobacter sp. KACC 23698]|uniref:GntR family transcriptional regulator n=1 Tax=Alsobacter sp. KACC 23698 TaxID=3149229 RepID=A0AAU7JFA7_9HYPH
MVSGRPPSGRQGERPEAAALAPVDPAFLKGLREHVHDVLRRAIIGGELPAGAWLNERQMAEQLGVSTTPLKEALRRLEAEGLVATEPRRGVRVTFDARQAEEMALARAALEGMIARMAAQRIEAAGVEALADVIARMRAATAAGDVAQIIELNGEFHDGIHDVSGCRYLQRLLVGQRIYVHAARAIILGDAAERERALAEHAAIFDALARRDADEAERAMRDHVMRSARHHVKTAFETRTPPLAPLEPTP